MSGLTCGVLFAERGYRAAIFAEESGQQTTSGVAAAIWYPYDAEPADKVIAWSMQSYDVFRELSRDSKSGVSIIELRNYSRSGEIEIPPWAHSLGARPLSHFESITIHERFHHERAIDRHHDLSGLSREPFCYRRRRNSQRMSTSTNLKMWIARFELVINCAGIGAKSLAADPDVEPHRGQVAIVRKT